MTTTAEKKLPNNFVYYIHSMIGISIMFGFGHLNPIDPITPLGMHVAGIFMGCIYLWSTVSRAWPSLLGIIAMILAGYAPLPTIISNSFGDVVPVLLLFAMTLFGAIQYYEVPRYISRWFLTRKVINGRPILFTFVFIFTTYIMSASAGSVLAILIFMWSILYGILGELKYTKADKYAQLIVLGTAVGAILGQASKPFQGPALMILSAYEKAAAAPMNYLPYLLFVFIMSTIVIALFCLLIKYIIRPDLSKIEKISTDYFAKDPLPPMNTVQKLMFFTLIAFWVLVLLPSILPITFPFIPVLKKLGALGIMLAFIVIFNCIKVNNKPIIAFKEIIGKYVGWDIYFLLAASMLISSALTNPKTGVTIFFAESFAPMLGGLSPFAFVIVLIVLGAGITQFANNGVSGVVLMPIIKIFSDQCGADFTAVAAIFCLAMHSAILTPAGSPYAALLFGNREWINASQVIKYGLCVLAIFLASYIIIGIPLVEFIFSVFPK